VHEQQFSEYLTYFETRISEVSNHPIDARYEALNIQIEISEGLGIIPAVVADMLREKMSRVTIQ
jgi:hypothetical protein